MLRPLRGDQVETAEIEVREAMEVSGYSRIYIYNLITSKRIKARKVFSARAPGVLLMIDKQSLLDHLEEQGRAANGSKNNS